MGPSQYNSIANKFDDENVYVYWKCGNLSMFVNEDVETYIKNSWEKSEFVSLSYTNFCGRHPTDSNPHPKEPRRLVLYMDLPQKYILASIQKLVMNKFGRNISN